MSDLIGRTLGQYRIVESIGIGGMATVYKAYQPSLDRYVAIKVLSPVHAEQSGFSERFQREAKAVADLHHPNILPVYDFGEEGGYSFIVMRYVKGTRTLKEVMETSLSIDQMADLVGQIAAALDHAHQQGVIHRDVKPSNVLMDDDWALLTDFGLAKMTEASVKLTGSGVGVGTPAYMSPEQGQGVGVDHRTDVYSLGIILFEMLTGEIPHNAETAFSIVFKRLTEPPPLPRTINPDIPETVERVILKALARVPDDRYATAGDMAEALQYALGEDYRAQVVEIEPPQQDLIKGEEQKQERVVSVREWLFLRSWLLVPTALVLMLFGWLVGRIGPSVYSLLIPSTSTPITALTATSTSTVTPRLLTSTVALHASMVTPTFSATPRPPTETPKFTVTPYPPTETPTSTATPYPPTVTPTFTATPYPLAATPTETPSPTSTRSCSAVSGPFAVIWNSVQGIIGCATNNPFTGFIVEENFEGGMMFWREPIDYAQILALFNDGTWQIVKHSPFIEGSPEFSCPDAETPSRCPPTPKRGFGMVWCDTPEVRSRLGNAVDCERGYQEAMQQFERGFMLRNDRKAVYVFYDDGRWERR